MRRIVTALAITLTVACAPAFAQGKQTQTKGKQPAPAAKAPPATAPAGPPQITAIGIRVTGLGVGANGTELKPFNESPGTSVVLAIEPPKGSGIVDIDDHASKVDAFADDKGQSLMEEARLGPFPHITEDGLAALVEVEVRARPSAGSASVSLQGSIAMKLAGGSKPFKASAVKLEAGQTFKIGATTLTITDPKADDDATEFTVNLPRSLLTTIRGIKFYDAKNAPLEGHRRGSGYFNEKAELELSVKTKEKVIGIEFELWQNLKDAKYPFSLQVGLGVAAGAAGGRTVTTDATPDKPSAPVETAPKKPAGPPPAISAGEGAESVEAVIKQMQAGAAAAKGGQVMSVIYPSDRAEYAQGVAVALAFLPMASMDDSKAADAMTKELDAFFAKHNIKPPFNKDPSELFKDVDVNLFVSDAFTFIKSHAKKGDKSGDMMPVPSGKPEGVKVTGDTATASLGGKDVNFARISGRWFIRLE
jgi:hypothetical protein